MKILEQCLIDGEHNGVYAFYMEHERRVAPGARNWMKPRRDLSHRYTNDRNESLVV